MSANKHLNMDLKSLWFKKGEFNRLISAVECNEKEKVFDILFEMKQRGDLE